MALGAVAALASTSAHAVWTFDQSNVTNLTGSIGDPTLSLSGFAVQNAGYKETYVSGTLTPSGGASGGFNSAGSVSNGAGGFFTTSGNWFSNSLTWYGGNGQGMTTGANDSVVPNHALDNNGYTESVLLSFSGSTVLSSIGVGYTSSTKISCKNNSSGAMTYQYGGSCAVGTTLVGSGLVDVSVFRWTGGSAPSLAGVSAATMSGWELVGNYGDMGVDTSNPYNVVNSANKTSSWWLVSAYNSGFTQNITNSGSSIATENRGLLDNGNDYFKLYAAAGTKCTSTVGANGVCGGTTTVKVPEPATLALTSVALIGVAGLRRRKTKLTA